MARQNDNSVSQRSANSASHLVFCATSWKFEHKAQVLENPDALAVSRLSHFNASVCQVVSNPIP